MLEIEDRVRVVVHASGPILCRLLIGVAGQVGLSGACGILGYLACPVNVDAFGGCRASDRLIGAAVPSVRIEIWGAVAMGNPFHLPVDVHVRVQRVLLEPGTKSALTKTQFHSHVKVGEFESESAVVSICVGRIEIDGGVEDWSVEFVDPGTEHIGGPRASVEACA